MEYKNLELQRLWNGQATLTITGDQEEIEKIVTELMRKQSKSFESKSEFISPKQLLETVNEKNPFEPETIESETIEDEPNAKITVKNFKVGDVAYFSKESLMFEMNEFFEIKDITSDFIDVEFLDGKDFTYSPNRFIELEPTLVEIKNDDLFERLKFAKRLGETLTNDTNFYGVTGFYNKDDEFGNVGDIVVISKDDKDSVPLCLNYTKEATYYYELSDLDDVSRVETEE